jgi:hypothetical protein
MQDDYGVNGPGIELDSGEWAIEPDQPTEGTSCLRYCPYCGEAVLAMEPKCSYCGEVIDMPIEPDQPTKGTSCLRYCPYCGEAVLAMEPKCCYCGEVIDMPLRLAEEAKRIAEEAKRIAEEATRRPAIVAAPAPTSTRQPMDWSDFWCHVLGFLFTTTRNTARNAKITGQKARILSCVSGHCLFMAGWGWTAWKLHVVLGLSWPWALGLPIAVVVFLFVAILLLVGKVYLG